MKQCYTIYLGARNTPHRKITTADYKEIKENVGKISQSFTIIRGKGYWKNVEEDTAIIMLALANNAQHQSRIQNCCSKLQEKFGQDAVLCQLTGKAIVLNEGNLDKKNNIKNTVERSTKTDWAKAMLEKLPDQGLVRTLNSENAVGKLVKFKKANPQADYPEARKFLKKEFPHFAKYL